MFKIGLTGNIGSGKSTVARIFEQLGIPVYDSDSRAKAIMIENMELTAAIKKLLGNDAYYKDGSLNRSYISNLVFGNAKLLEELNCLVHPAIFLDFEIWVLQENAPYVIKEAALLFESGSYLDLDKIIVVVADEQLRLKRSVERDGMPANDVKARMNNQLPQEDKVKRADFLIFNDERDLLVPQVMKIHKLLMGMAGITLI